MKGLTVNTIQILDSIHTTPQTTREKTPEIKAPWNEASFELIF